MSSINPERNAVRQRLDSQRGRELSDALKNAKNNPQQFSDDQEIRLKARFRQMDAATDLVTYAAGLPKDQADTVLRVLYGGEQFTKPPTLGARLRQGFKSFVHKFIR